MKKAAVLVGVVAVLGLATVVAAQGTGKGFLWDGNFWTQISADAKLGYVGGIGNLADFETAASKGRGPCVSRAFVEGLKDQTPDQIVAAVDQFYRDNPDKLKTTVIEVILQRCTTVCPPELGGGEKKK
jgi:hypothetical protein